MGVPVQGFVLAGDRRADPIAAGQAFGAAGWVNGDQDLFFLTRTDGDRAVGRSQPGGRDAIHADGERADLAALVVQIKGDIGALTWLDDKLVGFEGGFNLTGILDSLSAAPFI